MTDARRAPISINLKRGLVALVSLGLLAAAFVISDTKEVLDAFRYFSPGTVLGILCLIGINLVVVSFRLARILAHFGAPLGAGPISRASVSGHLASLFMNSVFGQIVGRHAALNKSGIPAMLIAGVTTYERIVLLAVSGLLCVVGGAYFLGAMELTYLVKRVPIFDVIGLSTICLVLTFTLGRSAIDREILRRLFSGKALGQLSEIFGITLAAQAMVLGAFVVGALTLNPGLDLLEVIAAAAVVSFAASIPITVNGWGVREIASIYMFGALGMTSASAVALSILIGLCSTAVILMASPTLIFARSKQKSGDGADDDEVAPKGFLLADGTFERLAAYVLGICASVTIFFQLHLSFTSGLPSASLTTSDDSTLSVNLSDPLAIVALAAMVMHALTQRRMPQWQVPHLSLILIAIGLLLLAAFVNGALDFGVTQWALSSRLIGWLVIIGYLGVGYLLVEFCGRHAIRRFAETMILTSVAVVLMHTGLRFVTVLGFDTWLHLHFNFDGYTGNRNAFAYQLLICLSLLLGYSQLYRRHADITAKIRLPGPHPRLKSIIHEYRSIVSSRLIVYLLAFGIVGAGILFTSSRGGLVAGVVMITGAWLLQLADRRLIELGVAFALIIKKLPEMLIQLIDLVVTATGYLLPIDTLTMAERAARVEQIQSFYSNQASQSERIDAIMQGLQFWSESPIFGKGLGFFLHHSDSFMDRTVVIHNTSVWLLTEMGLIGLLAMAAVFILVGWSVVKRPSWDGASKAALFMLAAFAMFSMVHEIFYQRIFWLAIGACIAGSFYLDRLRKPGPQVVCHMITGLNTGGAERMLTRLVTALRSSEQRTIVVSLMDEGDFGNEITASGAKLYTLGMTRDLLSIRRFARLVGILWREKPSVIMTWLYHADVLGLVAGWVVGVRRVIWNLRCSDMTPSAQTFVSRVTVWLLVHLSPLPSRVIVNSVAGQHHHKRLGYKPAAWQVISNGVELDRFRPDPQAGAAIRQELGIPVHGFVVGHVARFHAMKDYETLLEAIVTIAERVPQSHFVLAGKQIQPANPYFADILNDERLAGRIHLLGSRNDTPRLMAGFDVLIQSSAYGEGAPNVVIEAMACGVPCVVTDVGDAAAIVGVTGRVVPPRRPDELAHAVVELSNLPADERQALGCAAHRRAVESFSIERIVGEYRSVLREAS
ncbi:MAG: glycosyltransferase [Rhodospirillales bacterium]